MTPPPKRAFLSLKSMMVMCVVAALFVWANTRDRWREITLPKPGVRRGMNISKASCRGFPWTYRLDIREWVTFGDSGDVVKKFESPLDDRYARVIATPLLLNLAVALAVSIALALASERFLFSQMRCGREPKRERGGVALLHWSVEYLLGALLMSGRQLRHHFSLKSMTVMCVLLSVFVWANLTEQFPARADGTYDNISGPVIRGFPYIYLYEWNPDANRRIGEPRRTLPRRKLHTFGPLALNLALAIVFSALVAYASERFVFSRIRRGRGPEAKEKK